MIDNLIQELNNLENPDKSKILSSFFKTWKGQYGEWDKFLGITVPQLRLVAKKYLWLTFFELKKLLDSDIHEHRYMALAILKMDYQKSDFSQKEKIYNFTLENIDRINNWDLVDTYVEYVIWDFLFDKGKDLLYKFSESDNLWYRRISVISTFAFIRRWEFADTLKICQKLINDKHDLIHKATWWMLREVWKRNQIILEDFLNQYYQQMPRTMLRYAIERLDKSKKFFYMKK